MNQPSHKELLLYSLENLITADLDTFIWHLKNTYDCISNREMDKADHLKTVDKMVQCFGPEEAVKITVEILRKMNWNDLAEQLENKHKKDPTVKDSKSSLYDYTDFRLRLKDQLKQDYKKILVGNSERGRLKNLTDTYTNLYVVKNETGGVMNEHEVRQIELSHKQFNATDTAIKCSHIFDGQNRKVLMLGIAGVGKTISVNKFILDWAEGKENQDIVFIFPIPFRRLNLITEKCSLMELLHNCFFSGFDKLLSLPEGDGKVLFIFDGLDECRFLLRFGKNDGFTNIDQKTTVSNIVTNLIERHLVSSALIWITSRPAAASLIPRDYIDLVTEVRGFNEEQREEYLKKNSNSLKDAENVICHIRKNRSIYIMCQIPVFCWISLTVPQPLLARECNDKTPTTLTGLYTNFLLFQKQQMIKKYRDDPKPEVDAKSLDNFFLKLGKLAFEQLQKENQIFYKQDLKECGLDINEGSVYCGLCTQIFQEEEAVTARSTYSFIHLSIQEFLAALYVFFINKNKKANPWRKIKFTGNPTFQLHKDAIKNALQSHNGHLDLFLRFLMGLSLESNQSYMKELLPTLELKTDNVKVTADYIKKKIETEESVEKTINLFHCLNELKDDLVEEIQKTLRSEECKTQNLSTTHWSGLVFVLLMSEEAQVMFELQKYRRSDEALMRLLLVIRNTRRALLHSCNLTDQSCKSLSSVLQSSNSVLRELHLSNNDLKDSGVKLLSDGLKSTNCQLEILSMHSCNLTAVSCESLLSALQSNSVLRELDLSNNDLQDSGLKLLSDGLKSTNCQLEILRLSGCMVTVEGCGYISSALSSNTSHLKELDLSYNHPGEQGVRLLSNACGHPNGKLEKLKLQSCNLTGESCESFLSSLQSPDSVLRALDLTNNDLQDPGVKLLSDGLKSPNCQLEILRLSGCMVTEKGCGYVSSALSSNPSCLKELDLSYNYLEQGVKLLSERLKDPNCKLNKLSVDHGGEFRIKAGLHKYACDLRLDPNTAYSKLVMSEENRKVTHGREEQLYPEHPDRFDECPQVLCLETLSGRCYWEAEWSGYVYISVTYKRTNRKGESDDREIGSNDNSWSLYCSNDKCCVCHNNTFTELSVPSDSFKRVGVYVDVSAGLLSFYSVSDTHTHTHTLTHTQHHIH